MPRKVTCLSSSIARLTLHQPRSKQSLLVISFHSLFITTSPRLQSPSAVPLALFFLSWNFCLSTLHVIHPSRCLPISGKVSSTSSLARRLLLQQRHPAATIYPDSTLTMPSIQSRLRSMSHLSTPAALRFSTTLVWIGLRCLTRRPPTSSTV
jgi:hypothetical protein